MRNASFFLFLFIYLFIFFLRVCLEISKEIVNSFFFLPQSLLLWILHTRNMGNLWTFKRISFCCWKIYVKFLAKIEMVEENEILDGRFIHIHIPVFSLAFDVGQWGRYHWNRNILENDWLFFKFRLIFFKKIEKMDFLLHFKKLT